ncbi:MAG: hypothetical protein SVW57_04870 [Thermodesulfobacteriota bacterium]|nr:hypothetical protein [Thermodesulfobacteriota bacterium]
MEKEVQELRVDTSIDTCPICGYTDGFHVSFHVTRDATQIILICPQCHRRYNPFWEITTRG